VSVQSESPATENQSLTTSSVATQNSVTTIVQIFWVFHDFHRLRSRHVTQPDNSAKTGAYAGFWHSLFTSCLHMVQKLHILECLVCLLFHISNSLMDLGEIWYNLHKTLFLFNGLLMLVLYRHGERCRVINESILGYFYLV